MLSVATSLGRGVVEAKIVIDATGNADVAIAAGAEYRYGDVEKESMALQGTGFSSRPLTGNYYNSDYLLVDEADMLDIWRALVSVHITKNRKINLMQSLLSKTAKDVGLWVISH